MIGQGQIYNYDIFLESEDNFGKHNCIDYIFQSSLTSSLMGICLAAAQDGDLSAFRMFSTAAGENNTNVVTIEMDFFARTRCRLQC